MPDWIQAGKHVWSLYIAHQHVSYEWVSVVLRHCCGLLGLDHSGGSGVDVLYGRFFECNATPLLQLDLISDASTVYTVAYPLAEKSVSYLYGRPSLQRSPEARDIVFAEEAIRVKH
jgi:hypothetical protein